MEDRLMFKIAPSPDWDSCWELWSQPAGCPCMASSYSMMSGFGEKESQEEAFHEKENGRSWAK